MPDYTGLSTAKVAGFDPITQRQVEQSPDETPSTANSRRCGPPQPINPLKINSFQVPSLGAFLFREQLADQNSGYRSPVCSRLEQ